MKVFVFLFLVGIHGAAAVTHSLKYFYTGSSQVPNFPEFVVVGMVDEAQIVYYDSNTRKAEPKQDWMSKTTDQQYWERETGNLMGSQQSFKANIEILKERFNQTGGIHIVQYMYGCEWDDQTGEVSGYRQYGYDGEDFVTWDTKTNTWIAPKQEAVATKNKWNNDKAELEYRKAYLEQQCPEWLKKYVNYGRSSLLRTDRPSVSLLQKSPSSPVSCHATGFYPDRATMFWRKDGLELHEDVDHGEILPNHDGTFQMTVDLNISSVKPEDWRRYDCVFQLAGVKDDIIIKLDKTAVRINEGSEFPVGAVVGVVVGLILLAVCITVFFIWKGKNNREQQGFKPAKSSETSSENSEEQVKMVKTTA